MHILRSLSYSLFKNISEWIYFFIIIIVLFNMFTDFTLKLGVIKEILTISDLQYFGSLSVMLAINNFISKRFFGLELFKA